MGLVLDSSVLIVAEREATPVSSLLGAIQQEHGENEIVLSSITVVELEHGLHRAANSGPGTKATGLPRRGVRRDSGRELQQRDGPDRGEIRRRCAKSREGDSRRRLAHRCDGLALWLRSGHPKLAPLPDDSGLGRDIPVNPRRSTDLALELIALLIPNKLLSVPVDEPAC